MIKDTCITAKKKLLKQPEKLGCFDCNPGNQILELYLLHGTNVVVTQFYKG